MEINASTFKAQCLQLLDRIQQHGTEIVITKRGKPVARLVPIGERPEQSLLGALRGEGRTTGDIVAPTAEEWDEVP